MLVGEGIGMLQRDDQPSRPSLTAKVLMASPLIKRKNGRPVEQFRRSTAYGG